MRVIAHRGFGDRYPQNTARAVREAAKYADAVEIDVRRSGSGELVASHFERLYWVTDAVGQVDDRPADALQSLGVGDSSYGIPRLERVLDAVPSDVAVELDLKQPGLAADVLAATERVPNETVLTSFYSDTLWESRSMDDSVELAYNCDVRLNRNLHTARLLDCSRVNVHWALCLGTDVVERAHEQGREIYAWPVGSRVVASALGAAGVDGLIASHPGVAEWAERGRRLLGDE